MNQALNAQAVQPDEVDFSLLQQRLEEKLQLGSLQDQKSQRLFHGRGKCYPGLEWCCIDYFHPSLVVTLFREISSDLQDKLTTLIVDYVQRVNASISAESDAITSVIAQNRAHPGAPFTSWWGEIPETLFAYREGVKFSLSLSQQNIGYFLDIETARHWLETQAPNAKVLNMFAYTCAFSVIAKSVGAKSVVNIDMSKRSLSIGRKNHEINRLSTEDVHFFAHDILKSWGKIKKYGPYNVVIIDPPSFQKGSFIASKDYVKLLRRMPDLVQEKGCFLACLNSPEVLADDFRKMIEEECPMFSLEKVLDNHPDFPEAEEGRALKLLVFRKNQ